MHAPLTNHTLSRYLCDVEQPTPEIAGSPAVEAAPLLAARGIYKAYGGVHAVEDVTLEFPAGTVTALVGDNGAGKTSLIKILSGVMRPDGGHLEVDGVPVRFASPAAARAAGVETVYQDLALADHRDVVENLFMGREATHGWGPLRYLDKGRMRRDTTAAIEDLNVKLPSVSQQVRRLSGGQRQGIAIARAVHWGSRILIMDEPMAALGLQEAGRVQDLIGRLAERGLTQIVVSHNLEHVFTLADAHRGHAPRPPGRRARDDPDQPRGDRSADRGAESFDSRRLTATPSPGREVAFLFDLDGVLADTHRIVLDGWHEFAAKHGRTFTDEEVVELMFGRRTLDILIEVFGFEPAEAAELAAHGMDNKRQKIAAGAILVAVPGAPEFVRATIAAGIACALVSSASAANVDLALEHLDLQVFDHIVAHDHVKRGKPAPDPYLAGAAALGFAPADCIVFEDTLPGHRVGPRRGGIVCRRGVAGQATDAGGCRPGDPRLRGPRARRRDQPARRARSARSSSRRQISRYVHGRRLGRTPELTLAPGRRASRSAMSRSRSRSSSVARSLARSIGHLTYDDLGTQRGGLARIDLAGARLEHARARGCGSGCERVLDRDCPPRAR